METFISFSPLYLFTPKTNKIQEALLPTNMAVHSLNMFTYYYPRDFRWNEKYVQFTAHASLELDEFNLDAHEIIDMLNDPVPCPKHRRHKRTDVEVCSKKNRRTFRITLFEDYCYDVDEYCWCVKHVKPT